MATYKRSSPDGGLSTIDRIRKATREIFYEKGFFAASVEEIAARGGLSRATVYLHFKGKDELLFDLVKEDLAYQLGLYRELASINRLGLGAIKKWLFFFRSEVDQRRNSLNLFAAAGAIDSDQMVIVGQHRDNIISILGRRFPGFDVEGVCPELREIRRAGCYLMIFLIEGVSVNFSSTPAMPDLKIGIDIVAPKLLAFIRDGLI